MKRKIQILCLKMRLFSLKRQRRRALADICTNHKSIVNRLGSIEEFNPILFKQIDQEINVVNRMTSILIKKSKNNNLASFIL